jgi:predicted SAM-dependent methyltransferase
LTLLERPIPLFECPGYWRDMRIYQKADEKPLPRGKRRRLFFELARSGLCIIANEGLKCFIVKTRRYIRNSSTPRNKQQIIATESASPAISTESHVSNMVNREFIANTFISGSGIEIGALHQPLKLPPGVIVKYVDRFPAEILRKHYPELNTLPLVHVDIIDDGEVLSSISNLTQDFVIANHFLEHCCDTIGTIGNMLRVLKNGGVLFMAVPDKRFTFDEPRPTTSLQHLIDDHKDHGEHSKRQAYEEWARVFQEINHTTDIEAETERLMNINYSIHFHAWTQMEMLDLISALKKEFSFKFELEFFVKIGNEVIIILRKSITT